ncbi:helix-turn-helix domain-containing protein [Labrys sedimenti]|uniref:helix-turn-helix domain-containing protein n=1 Tax=Labrys sedimenti TaxID=3106036 RepID=UPI003CD08C51
MAAEYPNGLAQAMNQAGMDPSWLARRVGVDLTQLEAWAAGREAIPPDVAVKLAAKLKTTVADILYGLGQIEDDRPSRWQMRRRGR